MARANMPKAATVLARQHAERQGRVGKQAALFANGNFRQNPYNLAKPFRREELATLIDVWVPQKA